jgi:short-subunit dehydrogenase
MALDDGLLASSHAELVKKYPSVQFRAIGVNLSSPDPETYLQPLRELVSTLTNVRLLFNNAGYIQPGLFYGVSMDKQLANMHCNATSSICLTHFFLRHLLSLPLTSGTKKRGFIGFTSSSAGFLPTPISGMYGATKTMLTSFASAIATETKQDGIDVCCVHPSPIASNFYENARGISLLTVFEKTVRAFVWF